MAHAQASTPEIIDINFTKTSPACRVLGSKTRGHFRRLLSATLRKLLREIIAERHELSYYRPGAARRWVAARHDAYRVLIVMGEMRYYFHDGSYSGHASIPTRAHELLYRMPKRWRFRPVFMQRILTHSGCRAIFKPRYRQLLATSAPL